MTTAPHSIPNPGPSPKPSPGPRNRLVIELETLRAKLEEAESTLSAIRNGEVDALVVSGSDGEKIYTLQSAETPYRVLVEAMSEGAITADASGTILYANRRFAEMVGQPLEHIIGRPLSSFEDGSPLQPLIAEAIQAGSSRREAKLRVEGGGKRGEALPVLASANILPEDGPRRVCILITDLTGRHQTELLARAEAEARTQRDLAERRSAELARSNAELESFAYLASHDLKEPLRGIGNYAQFLMQDHAAELPPEAVKKVRTITGLCRRMQDLLDGLLECSRVGRTAPTPTAVLLSEAARSAVESLAPFIQEHHAVVDVQPDMPACSCDRARLTRLMLNLITNALKYNSSNPKEVRIGIEPESDAACGLVTFFVRDNGIGIDARHQGRIFEMFRRLHAPGAFGGGAGVGLSMVKTIVEQHGGRIRLESNRGRGSTFYISLPRP